MKRPLLAVVFIAAAMMAFSSCSPDIDRYQDESPTSTAAKILGSRPNQTQTEIIFTPSQPKKIKTGRADILRFVLKSGSTARVKVTEVQMELLFDTANWSREVRAYKGLSDLVASYRHVSVGAMFEIFNNIGIGGGGSGNGGGSPQSGLVKFSTGNINPIRVGSRSQEFRVNARVKNSGLLRMRPVLIISVSGGGTGSGGGYGYAYSQIVSGPVVTVQVMDFGI